MLRPSSDSEPDEGEAERSRSAGEDMVVVVVWQHSDDLNHAMNTMIGAWDSIGAIPGTVGAWWALGCAAVIISRRHRTVRLV